MKHKKMQKKGQNDSDDLSDIQEGSDNVSFEENSTNPESQSKLSTVKQYTGYDISSLVKGQSSFSQSPATSSLSRFHIDSEPENEEEIDVVESDVEKS